MHVSEGEYRADPTVEGPWSENPSVHEQIGGFVRGYAGRRLHRRLQNCLQPQSRPPHQSPTQSVTPIIHYTHIIAPIIHTAKKTTPHTHTALQIRLRAPGVGLVIQTANRRRGQRPRPSHDHTQTLDAQAYTGSDLLTPSSAMQGRTLLIGTHSMCSAGVGDPPRKPRSVAETGKQTEREPMMSSGAPHNVKQQAPGIGASPANSEQWRCSVEVA